jgi:hypothetical protein
MIDKFGDEIPEGEAYYEPLGCGPKDGPYWTYADFTCEHTDTFMEHVTTCKCVRPDGTSFRLNSRDDVLWSHHVDGFEPYKGLGGYEGYNDTETDLYDMAEAVSDAPSVPIDRPEGWSKVVCPRHTNINCSVLYELGKSISSGKLHNDTVPEAWDFPVVVRYGDVRNVCSRKPISIYAQDEYHETITDMIEEAHANPFESDLCKPLPR